MSFKSKILYILLSVVMIVSFQNCGQSGAIGLESQDLGKVAANGTTDLVDISDDQSGDQSDDQSDVQDPPPADVGSVDPVKPPVIVPPKDGPKDGPKGGGSCDDRDDNDTKDIVDADEDGNVHGMKISCADLAKIKMSIIPASSGSVINNTRGIVKVENKEQVSVNNHRGILILNNINSISRINNVRALLLRASAQSINEINNARALSLIDSKEIGVVANYRGLGCLSAEVGEINNYRGVLEVKGNLESVDNFRGILKVEGNVRKINNFRGVLLVSGSIGSKTNVKIRVP